MTDVEDPPAKGIGAMLVKVVRTMTGAVLAWLRFRKGSKAAKTVKTKRPKQSVKVKGDNATVTQVQGNRNRT